MISAMQLVRSTRRRLYWYVAAGLVLAIGVLVGALLPHPHPYWPYGYKLSLLPPVTSYGVGVWPRLAFGLEGLVLALALVILARRARRRYAARFGWYIAAGLVVVNGLLVALALPPTCLGFSSRAGAPLDCGLGTVGQMVGLVTLLVGLVLFAIGRTQRPGPSTDVRLSLPLLLNRR
jgi:hypothetical protein